MVYPSNPKDGVHIYSQNLKKHLEKSVDIESFEVKKSHNPLYYLNLAKNASQNCDILHMQFKFGMFGSSLVECFMYFLFIWVVDKDIKIVTSLHDITNPKAKPKNIKEIAIIKKLKTIQKSLIKNSDVLISHTLQGKGILLKDGIKNEKIKVISHGTSERTDENDSKLDFNFDIKKKIVLTTFGYLRSGKGIEKVLNIINKLPENYIYIVAGKPKDQKYFQKLKGIVKRENIGNRVEFIDFIPEENIPYLMKITDLFIVPKDEGNGIILNLDSGPLNLGLSYNKVILTSELEQFKEKEGKWGCIKTCDMDETKNLKESITSLIKNEKLRKSLKKNSKVFCENNKLKKIAKKTYEVYSGVSENKK